MTGQEKKRIEDYINDFRIYPPEYEGVRDNSILYRMGSNYRYDIATNTVTRLEGRINDNGDFELVGLYKFPFDKPEEKVEIKDELEKKTAITFKYTRTKYNELMVDLNHNSGVIDETQNTNWNLRDMISEIEYLRSLYYTEGHERNKLKTEDPTRFANEISRLYYFIRTYKDYISDMEVTVKHNSKYDIDWRNTMNNLKRIRLDNGLTQAQLAEKSGVNIRTLQDYEQGKKEINSARGITLNNIAQALGCTIEELLETP